ncbi:ATP-dependent helicase [Ancylomarina sp. DW003]|nr:ATP-dependent DNA helicase [Ancylomarina sp. DW003]MDE5421740.1 ATP-dependent helicase [Ancylomarina sp. DW003]
MIDYSPSQKQAIETNDKNLRIIACAGSGKTSTVAAKVAHLLDSKNGFNLEPKNIIAFTFTEKAAAELKYRILEDVESDIRGMADMYIGTIHGWCLSALQENEFDYQKFSVLDEIKQKLFIDKYYNVNGMKDVTKLSKPSVSLRRFLDTSLFTRVLDIVRESDLNSELPKNIKDAKRKYEENLKKHNLFDFTMIIDEAINCLTNGGNLAKNIEENLKYLIVDEYQDINPLQQKLILELQEKSNCKLIVVGDDDQNIYQWRGSNNDYIINFHKRYSADSFQSIELNTNYRSSSGITQLAKTLIANNKVRLDKEMRSFDNQEYHKDTDVVFNEYDNIKEENEAIVDYIENIIGVEFKDKKDSKQGRGIAYSDIVILLRTWNKAESIVETLGEKNIPFVTAGVNQLFDTSEVKAAMGIFKFLYEEIDESELLTLWLNIPYYNTLSEANVNAAIVRLKERLPSNEKISKDWAYSLQDIYWEFLENANVFEETFIDETKLDETREIAEIIFYNLGKFSQVIQDYEEINFNSTSPAFHLFSFISFVTYAASDYYPEGWLNNSFKTPNAVQIMTIHQAKGLEFPVVIIPGLNKNYLPSKKRGGLSEWHFLGKELVKEQQRYEGADNYEDERRLLYVALTRSQKFLLITRAPDLNNRLYKQPSVFIDEMNKSGVLFSNKNETFDYFNKLEPQPKTNLKTINLNFTVLKDFFDCPYRFKLISMYGFNFPLNQRMGLGNSFHNCLMEIHKRVKGGEDVKESDIDEIIDRQKSFPYIGRSSKLKESFERQIKHRIEEYYHENKSSFNEIEFVEQEIQLKLEDEVLVSGRIDLIKKKNEDGSYETTIIEFKSKEDSQKVKTTDDQLKLYALGHKELTGEQAKYLMTYIIGENREKIKTILKDSDLQEIQSRINESANDIRKQQFDKFDSKDKCAECFQNSICQSIKKYNIKTNR